MANEVVSLLAALLIAVTGGDLPNLALNKPTDQISSHGRFFSHLAVDGNKNTQMAEGSCSHTDFDNMPRLHWWQVDLQQKYWVLTVSVTNRGLCCYERLTNFSVEVHIRDPRTSNDSGLQLCYWHKGTVGQGLTVDMNCAVNTIGRYVRIVKSCNGGSPLSLCEVEVRGKPLWNTCREISVVFSRQSAGARVPHHIIASYENIGKRECAIMCVREASCKAFSFGSQAMGVVRCEMLAVTLDPVRDASWGVYTINSVQCPAD